MYLVDSSAWVEYFRAKGSETVKSRVRGVLEKEEACSCGIILVEILRGARTEKEFQTLSDSLTSLPQILLDEEVFDRASRWGFSLDRKGKTVSATGLLIASAAYQKACLLHLDSDFETIASVSDLEHEKLAP